MDMNKDKNILIIGAARSGKTTLARKLCKEYGYNLVSLDDIICAFEALQYTGIKHDGDDVVVSENFAPFLIRYLQELSEGPNFYNGIKSVIEGTHIDFERVIPILQQEKYREKYEIIGLTYNNITEEEMYQYIRKYDTEDDWTYWCGYEELKGNIRYFIQRNKLFQEKFIKYGIKSYDISTDRENTINTICKELCNQEETK